jgi:hypothetical protein
MDLKFILLGMALVVALVVFGKNPMQRDQRTGDPFGYSIEQKLAQQKNLPGGGGNAMGPPAFGARSDQPAVVQPPPGSSPGTLRWTPLTARPALPAAAAALPGQDANAPAYFLQSGQRIFFAGVKVYTLESDGTLNALPDGTYTLQSGDSILIRNGKRQAQKR